MKWLCRQLIAYLQKHLILNLVPQVIEKNRVITVTYSKVGLKLSLKKDGQTKQIAILTILKKISAYINDTIVLGQDQASHHLESHD